MSVKTTTTGDLYVGVAAIGKGEGLTTRKTRYLIDHHGLPVFRVGRNLYSRPSKVREWWIEREREHAEALARQ